MCAHGNQRNEAACSGAYDCQIVRLRIRHKQHVAAWRECERARPLTNGDRPRNGALIDRDGHNVARDRIGDEEKGIIGSQNSLRG